MVPLQPLPLVVVQGVLQLVSLHPRGPRALTGGLGDTGAFLRFLLEPQTSLPQPLTYSWFSLFLDFFNF